MSQVILYLHVLSAVLMGFYLLLPFLMLQISLQPDEKVQHSQLGILFKMNRVGQTALAIAFLTGGYLVGKADYPTLWWALAIILLLGIAAVSGIMGKSMRRALNHTDRSVTNKNMGKIRSLSVAVSLLYFLVITLMLFPNIFV
ncbi:hypothetical protein GCM10023310_27380 [Paenibacillus vulneris]|uniref:DUF2269 family protein n=2 Tax=Paenibacillus TaxID=44249 RepID=A0ABW3UVT0_9BACL